MTTSKGGRPAQYSREQLDAAIDILQARGQPVQPVAVKAALCEEFDLSPGINLQSLARELDARLAERAESHRREQVAMLPEAAVAAVRGQVGLLERELLGALGRLRADLAQEAGKEAAAWAAECRHLAARCDEPKEEAREAEDEIAALRRQVADLNAERDAAIARVGEAEAEVRVLADRLAARQSVRDELMGLVAALERRDGDAAMEGGPTLCDESGLLHGHWPDNRRCGPIKKVPAVGAASAHDPRDRPSLARQGNLRPCLTGLES